MITDFIKKDDVPEELIKEYEDKLPSEVIAFWKEFGFGVFYNGYLKSINPNDYKELIEKSYFLGDVSIPIFATGFGDLITWQKDRYIGIVKYRYGDFDVIDDGFALDCNSNQLTSLPSLPNSLQTLKCGNNRLSGTLSLTGRSALKTLDVSSNTDLNTLNCYSNALTSLSVVGCTALTTLNCYSNQLASLGTMPNSLQTINCSSNRLSGTLSITGHSALKTLDVSSNTGLTTLNCYGNALTSLNVNNCSSLVQLECYSNQLTSLRASDCPALRHVECYENQLAEDAMSRFVSDLPTIPTSENPGNLRVLAATGEGNVFTSTHQAAATAKRWNAQMSDGSPIGGSGLRGDINGDGSVDVADVNILVNIMLGKDSPDNYTGNANVDGLDGIDVGDVNVIVNIMLGKN